MQENSLLGNDVYSSEAVSLLVESLKSPHCRLEELHLGLVNQLHGMHERDASVLRFGRISTSLKSSLTSFSMRMLSAISRFLSKARGGVNAFL